MYQRIVSAVALVLAAAHEASGQTPPGSQPQTSSNLAVSYGSTMVTPNILLPRELVSMKPSVSLNRTLSGTQMLALVDLSISGGNFDGTSDPLAMGLETCRTTRLHWLQTGLTQTANGSFTNSTPALGEYGGPMPPLNDIPHTYAFYLFNQPANFSLPPYDAGRDYVAPSAMDRMNFSVTAISDVVGAPIAANYIRVQNPGNNATGSYDNGTCPASLSGSLSPNATSTGSAPIGSYTGLAGKVETGVGAVLMGVGAAALLLL